MLHPSSVSNPPLPADPHGCPYLFLAPMEGVGDRPFRKATASIGGFDEAVTEFLRVPKNAHIKSLAKPYYAQELSPIPLAAQIMGSDPELMAEMAKELEARGAPRIDLNCGCPSNVVTGRGAGSSLLKDPSSLFTIAKAMVEAVQVPVTVKMRSGYDDTSLFKENILAAQESGIAFITLHPRTKADGYGPPARWDLIQEAKSILHIPVVGNGDIKTVHDALRMLSTTGCDALMIGRGAAINPFIFHEIRSHFSKIPYVSTWDKFHRYIQIFFEELPQTISERGKINKMKQLMSFLFKNSPQLEELRGEILTSSHTTADLFLSHALILLKSNWIEKITN